MAAATVRHSRALWSLNLQKETTMDRRLFVTGLLGVAATTGFAAALPRSARALTPVPIKGPIPESDDILPKLTESDASQVELDEDWGLDNGEDEGFQPARHRRRHRRRLVRRWRRVCRRWKYKGHWRRRCRRRPHWVYIWFWI
jgi:hypothetical protein